MPFAGIPLAAARHALALALELRYYQGSEKFASVERSADLCLNMPRRIK